MWHSRHEEKMSSERNPHIRLSNKETGTSESMIHSDIDENGISENEASKRARASRKLLVIGVLLVIAAIILATVAIAVGLTLTGDVRRTIGEKKNENQLSSTSPTLSPSSHIPLSVSSVIPHTKHSISQTISPTKVKNSVSPSVTSADFTLSQTLSPTSVFKTVSQDPPASPAPSVLPASLTPFPELSPLISPSFHVSTTVPVTSSVSTTIQSMPECEVTEFRCHSGQCVEKSAVCNKVIDCLDQSDEMWCPECLRSRGFQCNSGLCIWDNRRRCNGVFDCDDLSDELTCPKRSNYFQCSNGIQISSTYVCNGVDDCDDNSDESNCRCNNGRIGCADGRCIMREWVCDGYPDCVNGTDEINCNTCSESEFTCRNYVCVSEQQVCDGKFQCYTGEDEGQCVHLDRLGSMSVSSLSVQISSTQYSVCADNWTDKHSHYICRHQNKAFQFTKYLRVSNTSSSTVFLSLQAGAELSREHPFNTFFEKRSACESNKTVALSCATQDCGSRKASIIVPYVAGGNIASEGRWPWVVSLSYLGQARCAGALIDQQWVITAGHCVVRPGQFNLTSTPIVIEVMAGSVNRLASVSTNVERLRAVEILAHPRISEIVSGVLDWDAALVKLERPVKLSDYIQPICLPYSGQGVPLTSSCYLAGWGLVNNVQSLFPRKLREAKMLVWDEGRCERNTVRTETRVNTNSTLCAGYLRGLPTGCQGDSGGPLMCRDTPGGPWFLAGIMSGGSQRCGNSRTGQANRFARIEGMLPWINHVVYGN